jgi:DNA polymerase-3 subunit delta'
VPEGSGRQVRIGDPNDPDPGTVRHLIHEMARLPVEGRHRVAVIESAHRMNEDAQNALLKTLEEPPAGATLILCAASAPSGYAPSKVCSASMGLIRPARLASPASPAAGPALPSRTPPRPRRSMRARRSRERCWTWVPRTARGAS